MIPKKQSFCDAERVPCGRNEDHHRHHERFAPFDFIPVRNGHILSDEAKERPRSPEGGYLRGKRVGGVATRQQGQGSRALRKMGGMQDRGMRAVSFGGGWGKKV